MSFQRQRSFGVSLLAVGLLIVLMGMGGSWGAAYGQSTTGPTPTIGDVSPGTGAEGPTSPGRRTAVAGESGELPVGAGVVAGEQGVAGQQGVGSVIENTGADSAFQWPLLATGVVFFAVGATIFLRTRKSQ